MSVANQLLDLTNRPVSSIAREVGCDDPHYLLATLPALRGSEPESRVTDPMPRDTPAVAVVVAPETSGDLRSPPAPTRSG